MNQPIVSLRPFIGSRNFEESKAFYRELGFVEKPLSAVMSLLELGEFRIYLQASYVEDWVNNTMLFIEVANAQSCFEWLDSLDLPNKYHGVRLKPVRKEHWGEECFLIDPAGVLLHFGTFYNR